MAEKIICIYCGNKADIIKRGDQTIVKCRHCKRETRQEKYQGIFDQWLKNINKQAEREYEQTWH